MDLECVKSMEEIQAEFIFFQHGESIFLGGGDDLAIQWQPDVFADGAIAFGIERAEQFCLKVEGQLGDFVDVDAATGGDFKESLAFFFGSGELSGGGSEEVDVKERSGDGGAIYGDKCFVFLGGAIVDHLSQDFFAGAALSDDEDICFAVHGGKDGAVDDAFSGFGIADKAGGLALDHIAEESLIFVP